MSNFRRLYRGETAFDFIAQSRRFFIVSGVLLAVSLLSILGLGFDRSIDFTGGTVIEAEVRSGADVGDFRAALGEVGQAGARVQISGDTEQRVVVTTGFLPTADEDELVDLVAEVAGIGVNDTNVDAVGATFGAEITRRAIEALVIFLIVIALFISWRFEWKMAVGALAALAHDLVITAGIYSLLGFEVTPATVIAILTILGYSLYDTVVVFDKVTENVHELGARHTFTEIANLSMNQVLGRSIMTSLTSLVPVGSLLFLGSFVLGANTLREFALALFVGMLAGTYSSIFVASPLLTALKEREPEWERMHRRGLRRTGAEPAAANATATPTTKIAAEPVDVGAVARPPRQRRKRR